MTKTSEKERILEDFFMSTWPSESDFDMWNEFSIIFFGNKKDYVSLEKEVSFFINVQSS
jgi:hypothetical protein